MIIGSNPLPANHPQALRQAAETFEARTLASLYAQAFATVDPSKGRFGGGAAEAQWRPVLIEGIAQTHARAGGIGLAGHVHAEMLRAQEAQTEPPTQGGTR